MKSKYSSKMGSPSSSIEYLLPIISFITFINLFQIISSTTHNVNLLPVASKLQSEHPETLADLVHIECNSNSIMVTLKSDEFNGMIYPKGLSKNSSCMVEYTHVSNVTYTLPLRSCNTMSSDVDDGIEYFNTVVVQPHRKLVTNQGKGFHIRCRYQTREKMIMNNFNVSTIGTTPVVASAPIPACSMKILMSESKNEIAESVKIGDRLTISIAIDEQDIYGMKVTNCLVRDGLNWGEQPLLNDDGCPVDEEIMGPFEYTHNLTRASVSFQAHKFPYTSSVYYQCNVRLCLKEGGGCEDVPPYCDKSGSISYRRRRRSTDNDNDIFERGNLASVRQEDSKDLSIEVYSGLHVNEADDNEDVNDDVYKPRRSGSVAPGSEEEFCISMRKFAIGVAIASLLLMLAVILLIVCILQRRRRRRKCASSTTSSIYSGPYSNRGYVRS